MWIGVTDLTQEQYDRLRAERDRLVSDDGAGPGGGS
jgi:hypothetical protein